MTVAQAQDIYYLALCIWREMRGESTPERLGCYWVIQNRIADPQHRWPKTACGVVVQPFQFSSFNANDPNSKLLPHHAKGADLQAWTEVCAMVDNPGPDPTGGANMYESCSANVEMPGWVAAAILTKDMGRTRFYRL